MNDDMTTVQNLSDNFLRHEIEGGVRLLELSRELHKLNIPSELTLIDEYGERPALILKFDDEEGSKWSIMLTCRFCHPGLLDIEAVNHWKMPYEMLFWMDYSLYIPGFHFSRLPYSRGNENGRRLIDASCQKFDDYLPTNINLRRPDEIGALRLAENLRIDGSDSRAAQFLVTLLGRFCGQIENYARKVDYLTEEEAMAVMEEYL